MEALINKRFDELERKLLLKGTTLINAEEAGKIACVGKTNFSQKGLNESLPHVELPSGGRRYIAELIVPSLAGIL